MTAPKEAQKIIDDVLRVADELGKDPRSLPRSDYIQHGMYGYSYNRIGSWNVVRRLCAQESGQQPTDRDPAASQGASQRVNYTARIERRLGRGEWFADRLDSCLARAIAANPILLSKHAKPASLRKSAPANATLTCVLSDLHFGMSVDPVETLGSHYSPEIACRRLALVMEQCAEWKPEKRDLTDLVIVLGGDIIEGEIHFEDYLIDPLAAQIDTALRALVSGIDFVRAHYRSVRVIGVPGNHGRSVARNPSRAMSQKWNSHERSIYLGIEMAFRGMPDVTVEIPRSTIAHYMTPGNHLVAVTHGDTEPTTANPGKGINTARLGEKLRAIDASRCLPAPIDVIVQGHWHQPCWFMTPHGAWSVTNGSLIGGSPFAASGAGVLDPEPAQLLFESVPGFPLGDARAVMVRRADQRSDLSEIVPTPPHWRSA